MKSLGVHKEMQQLKEALLSPQHTDHPRQAAASLKARFFTRGTMVRPRALPSLPPLPVTEHLLPKQRPCFRHWRQGLESL